MKKFILLALIVLASAAQATEVVVMEALLPVVNESRTLVDTRFYMDTKTGEGFVKATVAEERFNRFPQEWCTYDPYGRCIPQNRFPQPTLETVFADSKKIDGLMLMGDQAVYHSAEGNVVCGTMGVSRIFKVPTLYLSGNCKLESSIVKEGFNKKLVIKLKTK